MCIRDRRIHALLFYLLHLYWFNLFSICTVLFALFKLCILPFKKNFNSVINEFAKYEFDTTMLIMCLTWFSHRKFLVPVLLGTGG